jgi:hypothetical protein
MWMVHECIQAEVCVYLSLSLYLDRRIGLEWGGQVTGSASQLARECASIAMLPSPPRAQEC